jgi:hypothetical protein
VRAREIVAAALLGTVVAVAGAGLWSAATLPANRADADVTWTDTVNGATESIGDPWAWSACVTTVYNMGGGSDADMHTCDRLYPVADDIVADCLFNTDEGAQDWGTEVARCTWKVRD